MSDIILATINAKYIHTSFGLRYLKANLEELAQKTTILEFNCKDQIENIVEVIFQHDPKIIGFGVYLWNIAQTQKVISLIKKISPNIKIILGGPEVSYRPQPQPIINLADYVIQGEGDTSLLLLCRKLLTAQEVSDKINTGINPNPEHLKLPYYLYTEDDIAHRVIYVESSRGCPFQCEFCVSALEKGIRRIPTDNFLSAMEILLARGAYHFKFVDRTFNLDLKSCLKILHFFLKRYRPGLLLHFEVIPERFPIELRQALKEFPPGALQLEIGVQTLNPKVAELISRKINIDAIKENISFLRNETEAHLHADLIVGLPNESLDSFAQGFDELYKLHPHEIQVGILKYLRGTPISRHNTNYSMIYSDHPPYEIQQNKDINFKTMQQLKRLAKLWDKVVNSGNFLTSAPLLWPDESTFYGFLSFTNWVSGQTDQLHGISLNRLSKYVFDYLTTVKLLPKQKILTSLQEDFLRLGRKIPAHLHDSPQPNNPIDKKLKTQFRQYKHLK